MNSHLFIGRKAPLEKLKKLFRKKTASLVVVRGRRRIGKSRLLEEFAKKEKFYLFTGLPPTPKTTPQSQREEFARQLNEKTGIGGLKANDWGDLFSHLAKHTSKGRVIVLLDEISWMGSLDPDFLGKLKIMWDTQFSKNPKLILVLCGSISSWIEKNIISSTGFFGRITQKIYLEELSLPNCNKMLNSLGFKGSLMEKFLILSITGGVPWYIELVNPALPAIENIKQLCFEKEGILFDEFRQIFHDLFGSRGEIYQKIVRQLVGGSKDYKTIADTLEYSSGGPLSDYLQDLTLSGYIEKDYTWSIKTGRESRLAHYRLSDNYLRFYFKSIEPNKNKIEKGHFIRATLNILPGWESMVGLQFENLVLNNRYLILQHLRLAPTDIVYDNPYFQRKNTKQKGCQIDYLIQTRYQTLYLCEIKFSRNEISPKVIEEVREKIERLSLPKGFSCLPVLIHVNGYSPKIDEASFFVETINFSSLMS